MVFYSMYYNVLYMFKMKNAINFFFNNLTFIEKKTYLTVLAQYFAMTLSVFIPVKDDSKKAKVSFFSKPAHIKKNIIIVNEKNLYI